MPKAYVNLPAFGGLLQDTTQPGTPLEGARLLPVALIDPNPWQPRQTPAAADIETLAADIAAHGQLTPILVRPTAEGRYEIIAGERRWRAVGHAGLDRIQAVIVEMDGATARAASIRENVQRVDLEPEELGRYFLSLLASGMKQWEIAASIGKSQAYVGRYIAAAQPPAQPTLPGDVPAADDVLPPDSFTVKRNEDSTPAESRPFRRQPAVYRQLTNFAQWAARADWHALPAQDRQTALEHIALAKAALAEAEAALLAEE